MNQLPGFHTQPLFLKSVRHCGKKPTGLLYLNQIEAVISPVLATTGENRPI
jgi:hypothetical protein